MSEKKIEAFAQKKYDVNTVDWSKNHTSVKVVISTGVRFDLEDIMDIIVENWDSFDESVRIAFARKIKALDDIDMRKAIEFKKEEDEEESFKW